jgi:hypothetical protein
VSRVIAASSYPRRAERPRSNTCSDAIDALVL